MAAGSIPSRLALLRSASGVKPKSTKMLRVSLPRRDSTCIARPNSLTNVLRGRLVADPNTPNLTSTDARVITKPTSEFWRKTIIIAAHLQFLPVARSERAPLGSVVVYFNAGIGIVPRYQDA